MDEKLKQCRTMGEILAVCNEYYNLDQPLGIATKAVVTSGIKKVIKLINAKPKK